jgi:hypothetical protein
VNREAGPRVLKPPGSMMLSGGFFLSMPVSFAPILIDDVLCVPCEDFLLHLKPEVFPA